MRYIICGIVLFLAGAIAASIMLTPSPYPAGLPKNFLGAPVKMICATEEPLAIHAKFYINQKDGWLVAMLGRNYTDFYIALEKTSQGERESKEWAKFENIWIRLQDFNEEWREYLSGANKLFLLQEKLFFRRCFNEALKSFETNTI